MKPIARPMALIHADSDGEFLVHNPDSKEIHRLSPLMAVVYRHADGKTSPTQLVGVAREKLKRAVSKEMVISALDQLSEAGLLMQPAHT